MLQSSKCCGDEGAKSHAAAGFFGASEMAFVAVARSAPQQMKPMPIGRVSSVGELGMGEDSSEPDASDR